MIGVPQVRQQVVVVSSRTASAEQLNEVAMAAIWLAATGPYTKAFDKPLKGHKTVAKTVPGIKKTYRL